MNAIKKFLELRSVLNLFGEHGDHLEGKAHLDIGGSEFFPREPCVLTEFTFTLSEGIWGRMRKPGR